MKGNQFTYVSAFIQRQIWHWSYLDSCNLVCPYQNLCESNCSLISVYSDEKTNWNL